MNFLLFNFVFACMISLIFAQCNMATNCQDCTQAGPTCGWCVAEQKCHDGDKTGPKMSKCIGPGQWMFQKCPQCHKFNGDCRACTSVSSDCTFCPSTGQCNPVGDMSCANPLTRCPCATYQSCATCTTFSDDECVWCTNDNKCQPKNTQGCLSALTCPCDANKNCDSCLDDFNGLHQNDCEWCANGRTGKCQAQTATSMCTAPTIKTLSCPAKCEEYSGDLNGGCSKCIENGCSWCTAANSCVDPGNSADCGGLLTHTCPEKHCAQFRECDLCNQESAAGCGWCPKAAKANNGTGCVATSSNIGQSCLLQHDCKAECASLKTCDTCSALTGCAWCESGETKHCVDSFVSNTCDKVGVCGVQEGIGGTGNFFLGMFSLILILAILIAAKFAFNKFRGDRTVYQSI